MGFPGWMIALPKRRLNHLYEYGRFGVTLLWYSSLNYRPVQRNWVENNPLQLSVARNWWPAVPQSIGSTTPDKQPLDAFDLSEVYIQCRSPNLGFQDVFRRWIDHMWKAAFRLVSHAAVIVQLIHLAPAYPVFVVNLTHPIITFSASCAFRQAHFMTAAQ